MRAALYYGRRAGRRTWPSILLLVVLCALLGAVTLAAFAGARRTESAYGRYLRSIDASDAWVNVPSPDTSLDGRIERLRGVRSGAAWLGLDALPVVHGRVDDAFLTSGIAGSPNGELFEQDRMTVVEGRLPPLDATDQICLSAGVAQLFGVGVGQKVTYQYENEYLPGNTPTGSATYRVAAIVDLPPALVDQFDQAQSGVLPPAATAAALRRPGAVAFSWVGVRLRDGGAGFAGFDASVRQLAARVGNGYHFAVRQLDLVHQQVQEAIQPQAVALAVFGAFAALALLVLVGQALTHLVDTTTASAARVLRAMGSRPLETTVACGLGGAAGVTLGLALALAGAVALSPLAPVGPVRSVDPAGGVQFDAAVLLGGGAALLAVLLLAVGWLSWRAVRGTDRRAVVPRPAPAAGAAASAGLPVTAELGVGYALDAAPGGSRAAVRSTVIGSVVAVAALVTATVFAASLNGLVTHPARYGWNWNVLIQNAGGYGSFLPPDVTIATVGDGDGALDRLMASTPGVAGWSTFGFAQLPISGHEVPVIGLATHRGAVEPPTVSGQRLAHTQAEPIGAAAAAGPDQIELGLSTLRQLGTRVGGSVEVGSGPTARRLTVVGVVTLPSIGVSLSDHVSLGRGAMLAESTLLSIEDVSALDPDPTEAFSALPSTVAIDLGPRAAPRWVVQRIVTADPGGSESIYQEPRVLGAAIVDAGQMGGQPVALAVAVAAAVLVSLAATVVAATRRRRRELAVLKALGLTRGQTRSIVVWQSLTLLALAVVLGVPIGLAAGHLAWTSFASSLGVVPVIVVPVLALALGTLAVLVGGTALGLVPAAVAARTPTTVALRAE